MEENIITKLSNDILDKYYNTYSFDDKIDIIKVSKLLGFKVYDSSNLSHLVLAELEVNKNKKRIAVNSIYKKEYKNYYIAQELAYYLLNSSNNSNNNSFYDMLTEYSLNSNISLLANQILMPYNEFINKYNNYKLEYGTYNKVIEVLANEYKLPHDIINKRVQEILIEKNKIKQRIK